MSTFDDASLVMIPSGYKASKVYSVKPTDGTGDLTFTRSLDTATRVGEDGLIEKVRTNLVLQSEAFNTTWVLDDVIVTPNTTANPLNGALTADTITLTGGTSAKYLEQTITPFTSLVTQSVFVKAGTHQFIQLLSGEPLVRGNFDLINGTSSAVSCVASIVNVGNGFFRCSISYNPTIAVGVVYLWAVDSLAAARAASTASTGTFIAFGYQVESGDIATTYIETTTAAVSVGMLANVPRLDYLGGGCPKLLLEPQRTNLVLFSEQFDNVGYGKSGVTLPIVTANQFVSPDGFTNADRLQVLSTATASLLFQGVSHTSGQQITLSVFVKRNTTSNQSFRLFGDFGVAISSTFTATSEFQRFTFTFTASVTGTRNVGFFNVFNVSSDLQIYGFQVEAGAYATSYIPTLQAAVTRSADAASKTGISALIGQTEGTLFAELSEVNDFGVPEITIDNNNNADRITITRTGTGEWGIFTASAGVGVITFGTTTGNSGKFALAYSSAGYVLFRNGVQIVTHTAALPVALSAIRLNGRATSDLFGTKNVAQALLFKTRLSNAQLEELTA